MPKHDGVEHPPWFGQRGAARRKIAGRVTFEGRPVADAEVRLTSLLSRGGLIEVATRRSDPQGSFDFGAWPAERYTVAAMRAGVVPAIAKVDLRDPAARPSPENLELALGGCAAVATGKVLDSSGGPIAGAAVLRDGAIGVTSAADGGYRLCLAPGDNLLYYSALGYGGVVLTLPGGGAIARDVLLVPEATIRGRVVRDDSGAPQAGAVVSAWTRDWATDRPAEALAWSDDDGRFELRGLAPGRYAVWAAVETWKGVAEAVAEPGQVSDEVLIKLRAHARVSGRVVSGGRPVAGATVLATGQAPLRASQDAISQPDGSFVLEEVPLGPATVTASPYEVQRPKSLQVMGPMDDVIIEVEPMAAISGTVLRRGRGVADIEVSAGRYRTRSQADGSYRLDGLPAGKYEIGAESPDAYSDAVAVVLERGEARTGVDLDLTHGASIVGTVVDQDGHGVSDVWVRWAAQSNDSLCEGRTAYDGSYHCEALTKGTYRAVVRAVRGGPPLPAARGELPAVTLASDDSVGDGPLAIRIERRSLHGTVVDGDGAPVADALVRAQPTAPGSDPAFYSWVTTWPTTITTSDGTWALDNVAAGTYAVNARSADGAEGVALDVEAGAIGVTITITRPGKIAGHLVGYQAPPVVLAQLVTRSTKDRRGMVDGDEFTIGGLPPGRYAVTAQVDGNGDVRQVDVEAGKTSRVELVARGSGELDVTVRDYLTDVPVPGMACLATVADDDVPGVTSWDPSTSPVTDANGIAALARAPRGPVTVVCIHQRDSEISQARATGTMPDTGSGRVTAYVAKLRTPRPEADPGLRFDWRYVPPRVLEIRAGGPAAAVDIRPGDTLVSLDGRSLDGVSANTFHVLVRNRPIGDRVQLGVRRFGRAQIAPVTIQLDGGPDR
ncbi:MAG: carboxypeptidase regulatory-like domain-containing protein [Kofleriaceae bacterium]